MNLYDLSFAAQPQPGICDVTHRGSTAPYAYQVAAVQQVNHVRKHSYCAHHPGAGKTPIALMASNIYTLNEPVIVVCPPSIVYQWARQANLWTGVPWFVAANTRDVREFLHHPEQMMPARFIVPDSLIHEIPDTRDRFAMIVADECFVAGTLIDTIYGQTPIEYIVPGMIVRNATGFGVVRRVMQKTTNTLTKVEWVDGKCVCTGNHPFFTDKGWVSASELTPAHCLYNLDHAKMLMVQRRSVTVPGQDRWSVLREILLGEVENENAPLETIGKISKEIIGVNQSGVPSEPSICEAVVRSDDSQQPHVNARGERAGNRHASQDWAQAESAGRERDGSVGVRKVSVGRVPRGDLELGDTNEQTTPSSGPLQGRSGVAVPQDCPGGRREFAQSTEPPVIRQAQGIDAFGVRVVRVQNIELTGESGSPNWDATVYNLEISGHPSYFANGVLVHNCHRLKTRDARRTRAFFGHGVARGLRQRADKVLCLSGTPMPNNPTELYPFLHACFPEIAPSFAAFANRYCPPEEIYFNGRSKLVYRTAINKAELARKLRDSALIRPLRADILTQLPPLREDILPIRLKLNDGMTVEEVVKTWNGGDVKAKQALATARHFLGQAKAEASYDYLGTVIDGGDVPVIWCWHREVCEMIATKLGAPCIHGATTPEHRRDAIARFCGGAKAIVCTIQAASEGIDGWQHRTDLAIFVERSHVPKDQEQAIGRLWRIGQRNSVRAVYIESDHPIDYAIAANLARKQGDIAEVVG